jgi:hypothetical protein
MDMYLSFIAGDNWLVDLSPAISWADSELGLLLPAFRHGCGSSELETYYVVSRFYREFDIYQVLMAWLMVFLH